MYIYNKYLYSKYEIYRKFRTFYFYRFLCEIIISKEMTGNANMRFVTMCISKHHHSQTRGNFWAVCGIKQYNRFFGITS